MERQLWKAIVTLLATWDSAPPSTRFDFSDRQIVAIYYWSVIHDRPTSWACQKQHWPPHMRKQALPSPATMSRGRPPQRSRPCWTLWNAMSSLPRNHCCFGCWTANR